MPKMYVSKSIVIHAAPEAVFAKLNDFSQWDGWSPWNILEKGVKSKLSDGNKFFEWEGDLTGSGNMRITGEKANESVFIDLTFLKPWKSKAKVDFQLTAEGEGTRVTWNMQSSMPFFMFFMVKMMKVYIGMDFERGLNLLKDVVETGKNNCQLDFDGVKSIDGFKYIGVQTSTSLDKLSTAMEDDFGKLMAGVSEQQHLLKGQPMTIYNNWNPVKNVVDYVAAVPVSEYPAALPAGFVKGEVPATSVYVVRHTGPYRHLGNAWTSMEMRARGGKKFKKNKRMKPMEVYMNMPGETPDLELVTEIRMPCQ